MRGARAICKEGSNGLRLVRDVPNWGHGLRYARSVDQSIALRPCEAPALSQVVIEGLVYFAIELLVADLAERFSGLNERAPRALDNRLELVASPRRLTR
jgi:hypothetical protein